MASKLARFGPSPAAASSFPRAFRATGLHCGIKKSPNAPDLGLLLSDSPETVAAGCFTRNRFKAAPVHYSLQTLRDSRGQRIRAVVVNSGCANAVTGTRGLADAREMARLLDRHLHPAEHHPAPASLVLSTGVIGQLLPIDRVRAGIAAGLAQLGPAYPDWLALAQAFMTTDTFPKLLTHSFRLGPHEIRLAGIDKGAGMIHPSMAAPPHATLLGLIATDAAILPDALQAALTHAVDRSFNRISVDGDMSTNDSVIALANAAAANQPISLADPHHFDQFQDELTRFALRLAKLVVRDGEGASKFVHIRVQGAHSERDAASIASTIATSALVKTALNGEDANWGRILCALGYSPVSHPIDPAAVSVDIIAPNSQKQMQIRLLTNGEPEPLIDEHKAKQILSHEDLIIQLNLGHPNAHQASFYTCDLSKEYVAINADYRS
ncbi:ArgJ family protein [Puccinia triticina 1-1 BBBD Race 1]|uniref:Arginine biosynthesis bifunctional protein ArgJ, mitochondrial n=2 Tax=Puccinia triticina TaxID=208348 RepID=A0A180G3Z5_PUCT1|nr:uncharacterized protein PtA15_14A124 [Puccinia triticina]OAV87162.1 ArgJ family protein [Puccinia triticina 1-1 BBBD Race 1]WAQ91242.1 hypothetical protein PtA15_14A124 [Puccinia triticina]